VFRHLTPLRSFSSTQGSHAAPSPRSSSQNWPRPRIRSWSCELNTHLVFHAYPPRKLLSPPQVPSSPPLGASGATRYRNCPTRPCYRFREVFLPSSRQTMLPRIEFSFSTSSHWRPSSSGGVRNHCNYLFFFSALIHSLARTNHPSFSSRSLSVSKILHCQHRPMCDGISHGHGNPGSL